MSDKVEYEPVPASELNDYQVYHQNVKNYEDVEPWQGGVAAVGVGVPAIAGGKTIKEIAKNKLIKAGTEKLSEMMAPKASVTVEGAPDVVAGKPPIPTTVGEFHAPNMVSEHGFGPGAMKNVAHNIDQDVANELHARIQANPVEGFQLEGNRRILTPVGSTTPPAPVPTAAPTAPFAGSVPPPAPLTPTQKAMQIVKGIPEAAKNLPGTETASKIVGSAPVKALGTVGSLWEGGENLVRLWNHFKHNQPGRELLDVAGVLSNAATLAPTPASPWSNIAGAGLSIPIGMYQRHLEEQDKPQNKATGGLATLR
jgi:hypothetical protein